MPCDVTKEKALAEAIKPLLANHTFHEVAGALGFVHFDLGYEMGYAAGIKAKVLMVVGEQEGDELEAKLNAALDAEELNASSTEAELAKAAGLTKSVTKRKRAQKGKTDGGATIQ